MKRLYIISILAILQSCTTQSNRGQTDEHTATPTDQKDSVTALVESGNKDSYLISTYDNPDNDLAQHTEGLKELSDSSVFDTIHDQVILTLDKKHQDFFHSNPDYRLIFSSSGDLFQNGKADGGFIVYDRNHARVAMLVYNDQQNKYSELFRDIKVKNGLENAGCNYGVYGTLDYQVAADLIYQRDYLMKDPLKQIEGMTCKITDISQDEDFVLESGCFAPNFSADQKTKSFCIPTSSVYNNWECLTFDKVNGDFVIFYGQAFAD